MIAKALSPQQLSQFEKDGFIIVDLFTAEETSDFTEAFRRMIRSFIQRAALDHPGRIQSKDVPEGQEFDLGMQLLENIDHVYQANIYDSISLLPEFLRLASKKEKVSYVNQLLGKSEHSPVYLSIVRCRINAPRDDRFTYDWHQETFHTIAESHYIQTWAPMVNDATKEIGAIHVKVGSHQYGIFPQAYDRKFGDNKYVIPIMTVKDEYLEKYRSVIAECKLGQCVLFNGKLIHKSGNNVSDQFRYTMVGTYHDVENEKFQPMKNTYEFKGKDPLKYYAEVFPNATP